MQVPDERLAHVPTPPLPAAPVDTLQLLAAARTCWRAAEHAPAVGSGFLSGTAGLSPGIHVPSSAGLPHHSAEILCVCVCVCGGRENLLVTCSFPSLVPSAADLLPGVPSLSPSPVPSAAPAVSAESSFPQAPIVHGPPPPPTLRAPPHLPGAATTQKEGTKLSYCIHKVSSKHTNRTWFSRDSLAISSLNWPTSSYETAIMSG